MGKSEPTDPTICLEVLSGPMDGLCLQTQGDRVLLGRSDGTGPEGQVNDLVLSRDSYSSSFHAVLERQKKQWMLIDRHSTNGTWLGGQRLESGQPYPLTPGCILVVGNTVIRFTRGAQTPVPLDPKAAACASVASQTILNRARAAAKSRQQAWIDTVDLMESLGQCDSAPLPAFFEQAGLGPEELAVMLERWDWWTGELEWIRKEIFSKKLGATRPPSQVLPTPRIQRIMTLGLETARAHGREAIEPIDLLIGMFREGGGAAVGAIAAAGKSPEDLGKLAERLATQHLKSSKPRAAEQTAAISPPPKRPKPAARRPMDPETWLCARDLMDRLEMVQNEFHLADPQDRFEALCGAVREGLQKVPPARRNLVLEQLYFMFPVLRQAQVPPPPIAHEPTPHSMGPPGSATPEAGATPAQGRPAGPADRSEADFEAEAGRMLQKIFQSDEPFSATQSGQENFLLQLSQSLYQFALNMEELAKSLVQSVQGGAGSDSRYILPFAVQDLGMLVERLIERQEADDVQEIKKYLFDLGHWLVALTAAHQKAADQWHQELWDQISPQAIRNAAKTSALNKALGLGKADLWQQYEIVARNISPEILSDELNRKIGRITNEEFRRMSAENG